MLYALALVNFPLSAISSVWPNNAQGMWLSTSLITCLSCYRVRSGNGATLMGAWRPCFPSKKWLHKADSLAPPQPMWFWLNGFEARARHTNALCNPGYRVYNNSDAANRDWQDRNPMQYRSTNNRNFHSGLGGLVAAPHNPKYRLQHLKCVRVKATACNKFIFGVSYQLHLIIVMHTTSTNPFKTYDRPIKAHCDYP